MPTDAGWRVAIVDSGIAADSGLVVQAAARFQAHDDGVLKSQAIADVHGHGTRVAQVIQSCDRPAMLWVAQALDAHGISSAAAIAAAIDWSVAQSVHLIHLSAGLARDRSVLAAAISGALRSGVLVVASSPARGAKPYPAAYPGVLSATGDARCGPLQISHLAADYADFGGSVRMQPHGPVRGASIGAAHVTRFIIANLAPGAAPAQACARLSELAAFRGRERFGSHLTGQ